MATRKGGSKNPAGSSGKQSPSQKKRHSTMAKKPVTLDLKAEEKPKTGNTSKSAPTAAKTDDKPSSSAAEQKTSTSFKSTPAVKSSQKTTAPSTAKPSSDDPTPSPKKATAESAKPVSKQGSAGPGAKPATSSTKNSSSTGRIAAGIIGGIITLTGAAGLQYAGVLPQAGAGNDEPAQARLEQRIATLEKQIANPTPLAAQDKAAIAEAADTAKAAKETAAILNSGISDLTSRVETAEGTLADLQNSISAGGAGENAGLAALTGRMNELTEKFAALETIVNEAASGDAIDPAAFEELSAKTAAVEENIAALSTALAAISGKTAAISENLAKEAEAVAARKWDNERAKETLEEVQDAIASLQEKAAEPSGEDKAALAVAASALKAEIDRGGPFDASLATLQAVAGDSLDLSALKAFASTGVPTITAIAGEFPPVADAIIRSSQIAAGGSVLERLLSNAGTLVKVKSETPEDGNSPRAIVSRIEAALRSGDLNRVISQWETLPEEAKTVSKEWMDTVRSRHQANNLMQKIVASMLSKITPAGGG